MLLVFHRRCCCCCCCYGDIHWEKSSDWRARGTGRKKWHHTLRRSSSLSSSSRFLLAAVLLPWFMPEERGLLLFLFLSDSSRRPTRSSSLSSWNHRLLWAFLTGRSNTWTDARGNTHLEEGAAIGRRVPGESGGFDHSDPGDAQHLVLAVVVWVVQRERVQAVCVHWLGRDVTVAVVTPAPLGGGGQGCGRGFELLHQPLHLLFTPFFIHVDLRTTRI